MFKNSALLLLTEPRNDSQNKTLSKEDSNKITQNFLEINLSITKNQTYFSASENKMFLEGLEIRASSWRENEINDYQFLSDVAKVLDSPDPSLFLKYLENLSFEELISKAEEHQQSGGYRNALSFYDQALLASIDSNEMKITALIGKGSVLNAIGEYDDAIQHYDLALEIEPDNLDLLKKEGFHSCPAGTIR